MTTNMNIIDITNDVTEIKEEDTMTENTNMTTIEKETTVDEAFAEAVSLIPEELIEVEDGKQFERSSETVTIKTLINRYKKGTIQIPKCQRLYVWKESDVDLLADSILHNFPMGIIIIGECDKAKYLLDGLQRITSIVKLLSSDKLSKEDKKEITDYRVVVETIHGMTMDDMNAFIQRCNMGVKMSAATKHRAGLPSCLFNAVVDLAGKPVFREVKTNRTFTTAAHNELIAMHSLLAAAGIPAGKNTAAELCKRLKACEPEIMLKVDEANRLVDFLSDVFFEMPDFLEAMGQDEETAKVRAEHLSVKALNVNFAAALFRLMEKNPDVTVGEVQYIVSQIFAGKNAAKDYAATTSRNSADEKSLINRVKVLEQYLAQARKQQEMTQAELAALTDMSDSYISYIETAKKQASLESLVRISNALGITVDELLSGNQLHNPTDYQTDIDLLMEDCSLLERRFIYELISVAKYIIRNNGWELIETRHNS